MSEQISFSFDPMCPWAYQTSLWIRNVRDAVDLDITWRFFSLEEVNRVEGKRHPWERPWSFGFGQMRVGALIRRELGNDALDRWYAAVGRAFVFGPVVSPAPEGDEAVALWELVKGMSRFPHLYELRHPKTTGDLLHIGDQFRTYLTTRDWHTVENPAP